MTREEAIEILNKNAPKSDPRLCALELCSAIHVVTEALQEPEIVHCKDCRLRKTEECAMQYECDCGEQHSWENDNDYCSWGKRYEE